MIFYYLNDHYVEVGSTTAAKALRDPATGDLASNLTLVDITVYDSSGVEIDAGAGNSWPMSLTYVQDGLFRGSLPKEIGVSLRTKYSARIVAQFGAGRQGMWQGPLEVRYRNFDE